MNDRDRAVALLQHYLCLAMRKAGLEPDRDTGTELGAQVDHIIDAAIEKRNDDLLQHLNRAGQL
jgi:hypothetical protein